MDGLVVVAVVGPQIRHQTHLFHKEVLVVEEMVSVVRLEILQILFWHKVEVKTQVVVEAVKTITKMTFLLPVMAVPVLS
jgi:hypothetical protein